MSQLFSFKTISLLLAFVLLAEIVVLGQIYGETHSETRREALLVEQILSEQLRQFESSISENPGFDYQTVFALENLSVLEKLDISFVSGDGRILDSNHPEIEAGAPWSKLVTWLADKHIGLMSVVSPVMIAGKHVGDIVISNNLLHELEEVMTQAIEILLPWFLLFIFSSLLLVRLFSFLLDSIESLLSVQAVGAQQGQHSALLALVNPRRLPMRLIAAVGALNKYVAQQKRQLISAQEAERMRLAAELHDELGQHLTAVRMEIEKLSQHKPAHPSSSLNALKKHSDRMSEIVRSNLEQLNPPALAKHGLRYCLETLVNDWQSRHPQHQLSFSMHCHPRLLDSQSQLIAYRVVQECLTNITRHAGTDVSVHIALRREADNVVIVINDNGRGCDLTQEQSGFGFTGMKQRVEALSGELSIMSQPDQGMQVMATLPIVWKQ